ncbi:HD domain-containing protein [Nocardia arthritidis]|uniref:HD domain-containing protein n=1 Tax=Nocardia arthritidis TaxID=228602 RepID=A0A6G9YC95_9NOCA|nr:HD domain-containing protein [Nocardia arthritidis]
MTAELRRWAEQIAGRYLRELPRRWAHVQGVARRADCASNVVDDADLLIAAAWLHDVGYAPELVRTGFHPVDGAEFLTDHGVDERLCALVANHSCAHVESRRRGIALDWPDERSALRDALWWADITTSPTGDQTDFDSRIAEIRERYGPNHIVTLSITEATPELAEAVLNTESRLQVHVK